MDIFNYKEMALNLTSTVHYGELPEKCLPHIVDVLDIVKPLKILEIGFRRGCSALMWLISDPDVKVHSIDIFVSEDNHDCPDEKTFQLISRAREDEQMTDVTSSIQYLEKQFSDR